MAAGALDNSMYQEDMLLRREALKSDKKVLHAMRAAWDSIVPAGEHTISREYYALSDAAARTQEHTVSRAYYALSNAAARTQKCA